uniref:Uncharacterized protein n=1 Tax=Setaria digitata TaxID=48799 RepID=A0A915PHH4_9BILA
MRRCNGRTTVTHHCVQRDQFASIAVENGQEAVFPVYFRLTPVVPGHCSATTLSSAPLNSARVRSRRSNVERSDGFIRVMLTCS